MSEAPAPATNVAAAAPAISAASVVHSRPWLIVVASIALAALGLAAWQAYSARQELDSLRQEVAKRLAEVDAQNRAGRIAGDQLREATREAAVKIGVLEGKLAESQSQQIALEALYQDLSRNRDEWMFAEIEQTLVVANQQLQLAGNVRAALIALQAADARLQNLDRPQLLNLRKAISEDMARLKSAPAVDTVGISVRIDTVIAAVDKLPLSAETRAAALPSAPAAEPQAPAPEAQNAWTRFWRGLWDDVRQMVRVQRVEGNELPLLAPQQAFFLRENLKLRLLNARLALLSRDQAVFRSDLKAAQDWLKRYFDARDKAVANAAATLAALQKTDVTIELPDLSASLNALKTASPATARAKQ